MSSVRCTHCADVIGVYEPLVAATGVLVRETSLAADPELAEAGAMLYHLTCFIDRQGAADRHRWRAEGG